MFLIGCFIGGGKGYIIAALMSGSKDDQSLVLCGGGIGRH